jgi:outer membrane protein TolC
VRKLSYALLALFGIAGPVTTVRAESGVAPQVAPPEQPAASAASAPLPAAMAFSFEQAVQQALLRNPSAVTAEAEIQRFEAIARQTRSGWLPTLYGSGTYTRLDSDRTLSGRVISAANQLSANLALTVPLVAPQKWAASSRASDQIDLSRSSRADVRRQVALAVGRAYLLVVSQKRVLEVSENALNTARAHFEYSRIRREGGLGNRVDVVRAEQEVATDESIVENARTSLMRAREALGVLVGVQTAVDAAEPAFATPPPLPQAIGEAQSCRTDVQLLRARLQAAQHSESLSWTDYMPLLAGVFQPFYQNPPSLVLPRTGWQAQLVLTLPLYDGGLRYGQADERAALASQARASLDGALRQATSEVRTAFDAAMRAESSLRAAQRAASLSAQALELAGTAYRSGATSNLEMIDAERRSRDAAIQAAVAEDVVRQARLDLLAASGRFPEVQQ